MGTLVLFLISGEMKKALLGKEEDREAVCKNMNYQRKGQFPGHRGLSTAPPQAATFSESVLCRRVHLFATPSSFLSFRRHQ